MKTLLLALLVLLVMPSEAYELRTHANMTRFAQQASRLIVDSSIAADLGIEVDDSSSLSTYYYDMAGGVEERTTPRRTPKTFEFDRFPLGISETSVAGWLIRGTIREDDLDPFGCAANTIITWIHGREVEDFCNPQDDSYGNFNRVFK